MMLKLWVLLFGLSFAVNANAVGMTIALAITGATLATAGIGTLAIAFAINMVVSAVISKAFFTPQQSSGGGLSGDSPNPGNRQQVPPATDNKLPIVYGQAYVGGTITDLSITSNNQELFYVLSLCEVTNNGADTITFGDVYWGGKKVNFKQTDGDYTALGTVVSHTSNTVTANNLSSTPAIGSQIAFNNTVGSTAYTVSNVTSDDFGVNIITFSTSITVSNGATIYQFVFDSSAQATVISLLDESTGTVDATVNGKLRIYFYNNGSNSPVNSTLSAINVMQTSGLIYTWDNAKLMTNCAFAIIHITYNSNANLTGIQQTKFQLTNSRTAPGDCFLDYFTNQVYGAAIPLAQIDTTSLTALNVYCAESFSYTDANGSPATQPRFKFDGVIDPSRSIMDNLQDMASSCDCLIKYNEILGLWGIIVQSPIYTVAMALSDSNIVSAIQITPLDIAASYNVIECKFPDSSNQDAFNSSTFDLAQIDPSLLFPNEPVNKNSISLPLVNNDVRAQYIATRILKTGREDLQVQANVNFEGIQLEAGDVVTLTNVNYGWVAKKFRVMKNTESFAEDGSVSANLVLSEYNETVYDDTPITQFQPSPNTGIPNPLVFGTIPAPTIGATYPSNANPLFLINLNTSTQGIIQYAEVWYSAFSHPNASQLIFAGTTEIQSNGTPYAPNTAMPAVSLSNIPAGSWYFFSRMVNSLGTSQYSLASAVFAWKPTTFQYAERYISIAYADDTIGTNFNFSPTNRLYYGIYNTSSSSPSSTPSNYTWYLAEPSFGTNKFLCYANRTGRKFSFATGFADYAAGTGAFVPTQAIIFDPRLWSALPNGSNVIDLDFGTGQVIQTGTTTVGTGEIAVTNNPDGKVIASLKQYLDFGSGIYSKTVTGAASLTIDVYGRVVGFENADAFYMTIQLFTATAAQTVFNVTRSAGYISGQCLVFENGVLADTSEYTDTGGTTGTVTFSVGRASGTQVTIISFKSVSSLSIVTAGASGTGTTATLTFAIRAVAPFTVGQSITVTGVTPSGYNGTHTVTACTTSSVSFANTTTGAQTVTGTIVLTNPVYQSFSRNTATLTNASSYTPSGYSITSGYELLFMNGSVLYDQDYDIVGGVITNFPSIANGLITVIQWTPNNLTTPNGDPVNVVTNTIIGQTSYSFSFTTNAFNLYQNGVLLSGGSDYTTASGGYTLTNSPTNNTDVLLQQTFARTGAV